MTFGSVKWLEGGDSKVFFFVVVDDIKPVIAGLFLGAGRRGPSPAPGACGGRWRASPRGLFLGEVRAAFLLPRARVAQAVRPLDLPDFN